MELADKFLEEVSLEVRNYQAQFADAEAEAFEARKKFEPNDYPAFDGTEIAKKFGMTFHETGVVTSQEFEKTELGKARVFLPQQQQLFPVVNIVFGNYARLNHYEPSDPIDSFLEQKYYVFWYAQKLDHEIPKFEDVKDKVIEYWKYQKAFEATMVDAKRAAETANSAQKPLADTFGEKVKMTGEFTWYDNRMSFGLAQPTGIENPGEAFMETVFDLDEGQTGVAYNVTRDTVYIIRLLTKQKQSSPELNKDFISAVSRNQMLPMEVQYVAENYTRQLADDISNDFVEEFDIQWVGY